MKDRWILGEKQIAFLLNIMWWFYFVANSAFRNRISQHMTLTMAIVVSATFFFVLIISRINGRFIILKTNELPICSLMYIAFTLYVAASQNWATVSSKSDIVYAMRINATIFFCMEVFYSQRKRIEELLDVYILSMLIFGIVATMTTPVANWGSAWGYGGITTVNRNTASYVFVICFGICLYLGEKRKAYYAFSLLFVAFSLVTGSRKGIVQIAITVAIYVILKENIADKIRITAIIIVLGLIGVAIFLNSPFLRDTYGERFLAIFNEDIEDSSRDNRDLLRLNAFAAFLNRPIFGNGVNYSAVTNGAVLGIRVYSHCNYVEMLCNYGIVGFILYYAMYAYMIIRAFAMRQSMYAKMVLSCIIPLIIIEYGQVTYYVRVGVFPIMVLFLLARYGIKQRKENEGQN